MKAKEKKMAAQDLIMHQITIIGYGSEFDEYVQKVGDPAEALKILKKEMDRIAKMFGYNESWFD